VKPGSLVLPFVATAILAGCNSDLNTSPPISHVFHVIAGEELSDTVDADVAQALVVELPQPQAGVTISFMPKQADRSRPQERGMLVCPLGIGNCQANPISVVTDSAGRASVRLRFGTIAGPAWIYLYAASLNLIDSVHYTVRAAGGVALGFAVKDSSAYAGASYAPGAHLVDRYGNTAAGSVTATAFGAAATVTSGGAFVARQIGRSGAVFRSGSISDTAWITVPPHGTLGAFDAGVNNPPGIVTVDLDGSHLARRTGSGDPGHGQFVDWLPDGELLYSGPDDRIFAVDAADVAHRVTTPTSPELFEAIPSAGTDGSVLYSAWAPDGGPFVYRVAGPGQLQTPVPLPVWGGANWMASLSPDSHRIAYVGEHLAVADAATGAIVTTLAPAGAMPRWSPSGAQIVFNDDTTLYVVGSDGAGRRSVGPDHYYYPRADWSPDGTWLIARTRNRLELINVTTNEAIPLPPWSLPYLSPAWKH
jgi:hypothetical protein